VGLNTSRIVSESLNLDALYAIADAATGGKWDTDGCLVFRKDNRSGANDGVLHDRTGFLLNANAAHIAAFDPPTVKALIGELRRYRKALERIATDSVTFEEHYGDGGAIEITTFMQTQAIARQALEARDA